MHSIPKRFAAFLTAFIAAAALAASAQAPTAPEGKPTIILVHGAWANGSSWDKVTPRLQAKGYKVVAVHNPLSSLADDVANTKRAIALETGPVVLVGHSYGGVVITEAGNDSKVTKLVYVAAFAPDTGESLGSLLATVPPAACSTEARPDATGYLKLTDNGINTCFAQDLTATERSVLIADQGPTSAPGCFAVNVTTPAWKTKPSWYIVASNDKTIPPALEATLAKRMKATTITVAASHVAMLAKPKEVADFILSAAAAK